jgi:D-3-phosphoglycerate dehydrogenase
VSLAGKTLGIVGLGAIGSAVAKRAVAMEMQVLAYDPYRTLPLEGVNLVDLPLLLCEAHFVSLNCSLTHETFHLLGRKQFALMREGAYLINTSRGALVDEAALIQALDSGRLAGAALDVFEQEPLALDNPLRRFEQCIFGAHNASNTQDAVDRINEIAVKNLLGVLVGVAA